MDLYRNDDEMGLLVNFWLDGKEYEWAINKEPFDFEIREGTGDEDAFNVVLFDNLPMNVQASLKALQSFLVYLLKVGYLE